MAQETFACPSCGATAVFNPASQKLVCEYCHHEQAIIADGSPVRELDYQAHLHQLAQDAPRVEVLMMKCATCGAATTLPENQTAGRCPFCDSAIVSQATSERLILPQSVLPFSIDLAQARDACSRWSRSLWLAPSSFQSQAKLDRKLQGLYLPYWTYDAQTFNAYTGMRGDDYWETRTHTVMVNGRPQTRTHQVKRTRWRPVSGQVNIHFNDVLVLASESVSRAFAQALEPWDLQNLTAYQGAYLSGFVAQSYQIDLPGGFGLAQGKMSPVIQGHILRDIGGDHQRITRVKSQYDDVTFKHILLPVWLATFRYHKKVYHVQINARTGEVQGQRPWSYWKISLLALVALALVVAVVLLILHAWHGGGGGVSGLSPFSESPTPWPRHHRGSF